MAVRINLSNGAELQWDNFLQFCNNNAYCQDNETSWFDWNGADQDLLAFARDLIGLRRRHPVLRRRRYATGALAGDIGWYTPAGSPMTDSDWGAGWTRSVVAYLDGSRHADRDDKNQPILDDDLLILLNGWWESLPFTIPSVDGPRTWTIELDTFAGSGSAASPGVEAGSQISVGPRSLVVLRASRPA